MTLLTSSRAAENRPSERCLAVAFLVYKQVNSIGRERYVPAESYNNATTLNPATIGMCCESQVSTVGTVYEIGEDILLFGGAFLLGPLWVAGSAG